MSVTEQAVESVAIFTEHSTASRYFVGVACELRDRGVDVVLVTVQPEGSLHRDLRGAGSTAYSLGVTHQSLNFLAPMRLKKLLTGLSPNILVHAHEVLPAAVAGAARGIGMTNPLIFHRHHTIGGRMHGMLSRWAAHRSDLVVTVSTASARFAFRDDKVDRTMVRTALNGIDAPWPESVVPFEGTGGPLVVGLGRMRAEKGFDDLIRAMAIVQSNVSDAKLLLVGDGPENMALRAQAREQEIDCRFVGWVEDPFPYLRAADVVAIPSLREAFGITAIEAMAMSRPVVANAVGGLTEIIEDGRTGKLVAAADPLALAEALREILTEPSLGHRLGVEGRRSYEDRFTAGAMSERWLDCYKVAATPDRIEKG